ncbi:aconitase X [Marinobacterium rhizophilum]|uniref:Aconitase X catalytic domain-containing protein n=1 Tax=Marinobacterium rhizophilum TaxID=420402 RepID=A0ABY5HKZ5_9GAMM|nr:aconitase X catalytic domain-containing protein [Marinobacterium rhizophilum]UTW13065.1 aconitase X catalytic domain-containing protein [Marinobacterium rhizophilum]
MVQLSEYDERLLSGAEGKAKQLAMQVMLKAAEVSGAPCLIDVSLAHVNSCFYSGEVGVDFAEFLLAEGGTVAVPTLTNVGLIDLLHPELRPEKSNEAAVKGAKRLMAIYEQLGCEVVWTCAPYQLKKRPGLGDQIVGSESNAVAFYNSVLGARTNKYGDFLDICAAVTGRAPLAGLHRDECRRGEILFRLADIPMALRQEDIFYHVLGIVLGWESGSQIPVIDGLPATASEDQLKAISAAGAASGSVSLFHAVGVTPEATTLDDAFQGGKPDRVVDISPQMLIKARDALTNSTAGKLGAVCLGTPHFSYTEFQQLVPLVEGRKVHPEVNFYISTSRFILDQVREKGWLAIIEQAGIRMIVDTCTYFTPVVNGIQGRVMTNSGKWAYYAPGMLKLGVVFGSMQECVESAVRGDVWRDEQLWSGEFWGRAAV